MTDQTEQRPTVANTGSPLEGNRAPRRRGREWLRLIASGKRFGRIKRAVQRCFILSDGQPILTRNVLERAYPKLRHFTDWHYLAARRALRHHAEVIARNRFGRGRPCLWAPQSVEACEDVANTLPNDRHRSDDRAITQQMLAISYNKQPVENRFMHSNSNAGTSNKQQ